LRKLEPGANFEHAHASSLGSWGGRKRRGYSKRAGALLKGMEQQLYGSKGQGRREAFLIT